MRAPLAERTDATLHVSQTARDAMSSLGNYFAFQEAVQGTNNNNNPKLLLLLHLLIRAHTLYVFLQGTKREDFELSSLWHQGVYTEYIKWLRSSYPSGNTINNKSSHLMSFLDVITLHDDYVSNVEVQGKIKQALAAFREAAASGRAQYQGEIGRSNDEEQLIAKGSFFAVREMACFVLWLIARWKRFQPSFERTARAAAAAAAASSSSSSSTPPKSAVPMAAVPLYTQARIMQETIMTLLVVFMGGLRRQVLASLCLDNVSWNASRTQCFLRLTNEKVVRMGSPKMPIAAAVQRMLEFYKQRVRHHLLLSKENVNTYFITTEGTDMSCACTHTHTHTHPIKYPKPKLNHDFALTLLFYTQAILCSMKSSVGW
jgi:hypothetical protein